MPKQVIFKSKRWLRIKNVIHETIKNSWYDIGDEEIARNLLRHLKNTGHFEAQVQCVLFEAFKKDKAYAYAEFPINRQDHIDLAIAYDTPTNPTIFIEIKAEQSFKKKLYFNDRKKLIKVVKEYPDAIGIQLQFNRAPLGKKSKTPKAISEFFKNQTEGFNTSDTYCFENGFWDEDTFVGAYQAFHYNFYKKNILDREINKTEPSLHKIHYATFISA